MRVVLDTNVLVSALGWRGGNEHELVKKCFQKHLIVVCSPDTIEEFEKVALRPKFDFSPEEIDEFITAILEVCELVIPEETINAVREDPSDNKFLETALAGQADFLITGDKHLLSLKEFKGIKIVKPAEFLERSGSTKSLPNA